MEDTLRSFVAGAAAALLGCRDDVVTRTLADVEAREAVTRFAHDTSAPVLVVSWGEGHDATIMVETEVLFHPASVCFIKRHPTLDETRALHPQLRVVYLGEGTPFDSFYSCVHHFFAPYFKSFTAGGDERGGGIGMMKRGVPEVKRKLGDLESSLLRNCYQYEVVPLVRLALHPDIKSQAARGPLRLDDFAKRMEDTTFLDALQVLVNKWITELKTLTKKNRDASQGGVVQEVGFWLNFEKALKAIQEQLKSQEVQFTLEMLKSVGRVNAITRIGFEEQALRQALATVMDYNLLLNEFPVSELTGAATIDRVTDAIVKCFAHMERLRTTRYPLPRACQLIIGLSRDHTGQMVKVLEGKDIMRLPFREFVELHTECMSSFDVWNTQVGIFESTVKNVVKKRGEKAPTAFKEWFQWHKFSQEPLERRLHDLHAFRFQDDELRKAFKFVVSSLQDRSYGRGAPTLRDVDAAFEYVASIDVLDTSEEGQEAWEAALKRYDELVQALDIQFVDFLRQALDSTKNVSEMFRILFKFRVLLVRPAVRAVVLEYKPLLIDRVREDVDNLADKIEDPTSAVGMTVIRGLPPVASTVVWAKQLLAKLDENVGRLELVLGKEWSTDVAGQTLKGQVDAFHNRLGISLFVKGWIKSVQHWDLNAKEPIFAIIGFKGSFQLMVNFSPEVFDLPREVQLLDTYGFPMPEDVVEKAQRVGALHDTLVLLQEAARAYVQASGHMHEGIRVLLDTPHAEVQKLISEGTHLRWGSGSLVEYAQKMAYGVEVFANRIQELVAIEEALERHLRVLQECPLKRILLTDELEAMQLLVNSLDDETYRNLDAWISHVNKRLESVLRGRFQEAAAFWSSELAKGKTIFHDRLSRSRFRLESIDTPAPDDGSDAPLQPIELRVRVTNKAILVDPPVESVRTALYQQFRTWMGIICDQRPLRAPYAMVLPQTHWDLWRKESSIKIGVIRAAYDEIEKVLGALWSTVQYWDGFQYLWILDPERLFAQLGSDLSSWRAFLERLHQSRKQLETTAIESIFGSVFLDSREVEDSVTVKLESLLRNATQSYGRIVGDNATSLVSSVAAARSQLEAFNLETSSLSDMVEMFGKMASLKAEAETWNAAAKEMEEGYALLRRHKFKFPKNWIDSDLVEGEMSAFNSIFDRVNQSMSSHANVIRDRIITEAQAVETKIDQFRRDWERDKPVSGTISPAEALRCLHSYEDRLGPLVDAYDFIAQANQALDVNLPLKCVDKLVELNDDLHGLSDMWSEVQSLMTGITELKDTPWLEVAPRKLRPTFKEALHKLDSLPASIRELPALAEIEETVKRYYDMSPLVAELKSEALKERHWKTIMSRCKLHWTLPELILGTVLDSNILDHAHDLKDVFVLAQGEVALEEYLNHIKETWNTYVLDFVNYHNKCKLVRGWDDIFAKAAEHLESLASMKLSPYYKPFEEEVVAWETKLNRVHTLFDVWHDVQRRWVYLEGIFSRSAEIKAQLPNEFQRFHSVDHEFLALMSKVYKYPKVMDTLNIEGIQHSLDRLADLLAKIQKSLGQYLEKQRSAFPRFYFVGDEDLLEIIANGNEPTRVAKHFKKMFAGLAALDVHPDGVTLQRMVSKEGEVVPFTTPISIAETPGVIKWLTKVQDQMQYTLVDTLNAAIRKLGVLAVGKWSADPLVAWMDEFPAQLVVLAYQVFWTQEIEQCLRTHGASVSRCIQNIDTLLHLLADQVLQDLPPILRKKCEFLIMESVHFRGIARQLMAHNITSPEDFEWLFFMRFYWNERERDPLRRLRVSVANADFFYGFEYLGVGDRLVQTSLTDRFYLTMAQALHGGMGGSPYGPAGTGKTESVKQLGGQLGRYVLVFNCDEAFDVKSMARIFVGLCQVGAWGCFDEFNRLEERMLSAVSQQIRSIQLGLQGHQQEIELLERSVPLNPHMGIFVTMNPGYAGRRNLPDNLKNLFRPFAMIRPDSETIAEVMLFSQGFRTAEALARKVVPLFGLCESELSSQSHYDWGLRALKAVLSSSGQLKRHQLADTSSDGTSDPLVEQGLLVMSFCQTVIPKLVAEDVPLLYSLVRDVFPDAEFDRISMERLHQQVLAVATERHLVPGGVWVEKILQLHQVQQLAHGIMVVGSSASGKTTAWQVLAEAMGRAEGVEVKTHVLDPKSISKEELFGMQDSVTRDWTDGLFTGILRRILDNVRGEMTKRHWIVFDGDVDSVWVENLNSVLDDNKVLTLPNGERLGIPPNVRILFEVQDLNYATPATVSRCGMVWFSEDIISTTMILQYYINRLYNLPLRVEDARTVPEEEVAETQGLVALQVECADILQAHFDEEGIVQRALCLAGEEYEHVMDFTRMEHLTAFFSLVNKAILDIYDYNVGHPGFPMTHDHKARFLLKRLLFAILWGFAGSVSLGDREDYGKTVGGLTDAIPTPDPSRAPLIDYHVNIDTGEWVLWSEQVPSIDVDPEQVVSSDLVIPTVDTVRHMEVMRAWLAEHRPLLLCGPPGSGKTMSLNATLRAFPEYQVVNLSFSSGTSPETLLKKIEQYCCYIKTSTGLVLKPTQVQKWLIVFCDEINLPEADKYGTQRVIALVRQLVERGGFWRTLDRTWVQLERIQFVGAGNPPSYPGRVPLSHRFLRHAPLILVDYPGTSSMHQIYGTLSRGLLKLQPRLQGESKGLTAAMVEMYEASKERFTLDVQPHYVYSPRELSRWMRAMFEAIRQMSNLTRDTLIRLWAYEGLRLFQDRLVTEEEREWTDRTLDTIATKHFPGLSANALRRPILFSSWITGVYESVDIEDLRNFVQGKAETFCEEEFSGTLVIHNQFLDHLLRVDRIVKQPIGHCLLMGISGSGRTILTKFTAWMNDQSVFQLKTHKNYTVEDFEEDLRGVVKRAGVRGERLTFIFDEGNVLSSAFLEAMNSLLASGEVPGLFEGDDFRALIRECGEAALREGLILNTEEELYARFVEEVQRNLHVVFTMNPTSTDFSQAATTSPALFNRCVVDWVGDWSDVVLYQVGYEMTAVLDFGHEEYVPPTWVARGEEFGYRDAVVNSMVHVHKTVRDLCRLQRDRNRATIFVTPRHYMDMVEHLISVMQEKHDELEDDRSHISRGLEKLQQTEHQVTALEEGLKRTEAQLEVRCTAANAKLQEIIQNEQEASHTKEEAIAIAHEVECQSNVAGAQARQVKEGLADGERQLADAKAAVEMINRKQIDEYRSLARPPEAVRMALEAVCLVMGKGTSSWDDIRKVMMKPDFIPNILDFDPEHLWKDAKLREKLEKEFLSNPHFNFETINKASRACGPLVAWVKAQFVYGGLLNQLQPARDELERLEGEVNALEERKEELQSGVIPELEARVQQYKTEYASMIAEIEATKNEMNDVKAKMERAMALLQSLASERERWIEEMGNMDLQSETLVGDVLLASMFLSYIGFFDEMYRKRLVDEWKRHFAGVGISVMDHLSLVDYLSTPNDRLAWHANGLSADDLCVENAILLRRFTRYPLVIDPSGQATEFLVQQYKEASIQKTSFADESFRKLLEQSLRFGRSLLIENVESFDPILNPVLNKDVCRAGGRNVVRLGNKEIDFSPAFRLFLTTREPTSKFSPTLCSRVSFVNFTITASSLQAQCLHQVLKAERPDVDEKRSNLLKLQGDFKVRLRNLEKQLLTVLSESKGNLLEDNNLVVTLETVKSEAQEIQSKIADSEAVMEELARVSAVYQPIACYGTQIYTALRLLPEVHFLYHFSLDFFLSLFRDVLHKTPELNGLADANARLNILTRALFRTVFVRVARSIRYEDRIMWALRLAQIRLGSAANEHEWTYLIKGHVGLSPSKAPPRSGIPEGMLTPEEEKRMNEFLLSLPHLAETAKHIGGHAMEWGRFLQSSHAETCIPSGWQRTETGEPLSLPGRALQNLLVVKALRPDRLVATATRFLETYFGEGILQMAPAHHQLVDIVSKEIAPNIPVLLCSTPGNDPGSLVDEVAAELKCSCCSLAMGSSESIAAAERAIAHGMRNGGWVMLRNVHMSLEWIAKLEKDLQQQTTNVKAFHEGFRLLLTSDIHPRLPVGLLVRSTILVLEPPVGLKSSLEKAFTATPADRIERPPIQHAQVVFLLAWFHAVIQDRLRYAPLGWSKVYEFNDADFRFALDTLSCWVDRATKGQGGKETACLPWVSIRTLLGVSIYGGKIDNDFDARFLDSFLKEIFTEERCRQNSPLLTQEGGTVLCGPSAFHVHDVLEWVSKIPDAQSPSWLGLPDNAERMLLTLQGHQMLTRLQQAQVVEGGEVLEDVSKGGVEDRVTRPKWMRELDLLVDDWLTDLPESLELPESTPQKLEDPLFRCFVREMRTGARLLEKIRMDLGDVALACDGTSQPTSYTSSLMRSLSKGLIPCDWQVYPIPPTTPLGDWLDDFSNRVRKLATLSAESDYRNKKVWLGGLFKAQAFITASRQAVAQAKGWPLEMLEPVLEIGGEGSDSECSFVLEGLSLEGAGWSAGLVETYELTTALPSCVLHWINPSVEGEKPTGVVFPLYLNDTRRDVLVSVPLKSIAPAGTWFRRGAALIAWKLATQTDLDGTAKKSAHRTKSGFSRHTLKKRTYGTLRASGRAARDSEALLKPPESRPRAQSRAAQTAAAAAAAAAMAAVEASKKAVMIRRRRSSEKFRKGLPPPPPPPPPLPTTTTTTTTTTSVAPVPIPKPTTSAQGVIHRPPKLPMGPMTLKLASKPVEADLSLQQPHPQVKSEELPKKSTPISVERQTSLTSIPERPTPPAASIISTPPKLKKGDSLSSIRSPVLPSRETGKTEESRRISSPASRVSSTPTSTSTPPKGSPKPGRFSTPSGLRTPLASRSPKSSPKSKPRPSK